uniref:Uncharacterized protein n=1 Tax=Tetradesmus obliquus TaxID=3088 RepID=A0A383WMM2_TETOB|eukprot:jgi/Sobl393_1/17941/SZX78747.1
MMSHQSLSALSLLLALLACAQLGASAGRVLLNPIHDSSLTLTGPGTPKVKASLAHTPASVASSINIRSEKPYVMIDHSEPGPKIVAGGETAVDTAQGPTFKHSSGKNGVQMRFDSGKRAFEVTHSSTVTANFPATAVEVGGGTPLAVSASHTITGPSPNSTVAISAGDGPSARHSWSVNLGPGMGRRM